MEKVELFDVMDIFSDYDYSDEQLQELLKVYNSKVGRLPYYELEDFYDEFVNCCADLEAEGFSESDVLKKAPKIIAFYRKNSFRFKLCILDSINMKKEILNNPGILISNQQRLYARTRLFKDERNNLAFSTILRMTDKQLLDKFDLTSEQLEKDNPLDNAAITALMARQRSKSAAIVRVKAKKLVKTR